MKATITQAARDQRAKEIEVEGVEAMFNRIERQTHCSVRGAALRRIEEYAEEVIRRAADGMASIEEERRAKERVAGEQACRDRREMQRHERAHVYFLLRSTPWWRRLFFNAARFEIDHFGARNVLQGA